MDLEEAVLAIASLSYMEAVRSEQCRVVINVSRACVVVGSSIVRGGKLE